jgi:hypothetical protein
VDKIVLNADSQGAGSRRFLLWWRAPTVSEETLDGTHLMRMAGCFCRRIHGYTGIRTLTKTAKGNPVVHCPAGERKYELAKEYLTKTNITQGVFLILAGRAPGADVGRQRQPSSCKYFSEIVKLAIGDGFVIR